MHPPPDAQPSPAPAAPKGWAARWGQRHFYDYNAAATSLWLLLALGGLCSAAWAVQQVAGLSPQSQLQVAMGIGMTVMAALFPVQIQRTKYSIGVGDIFVFGLLALHGAPAAALAAGAEGLVGALRTSKRLTSRISTPATAMLAMALCGQAAGVAQQALVAAGWSLGSANFAVLCAVALPYFAGTSLPLLAVVAAKNKKPLSLRDWIQNYGWLAAVYLVAAAIAGVLTMNSHQFGPAVFVVAAVVTAAAVLLIRVSLQRHEVDYQVQQARVADAEQEAELNQQRFTAAFSHAAIGMAIVRHDGLIQQVNQALSDLLRQPLQGLLQQRFSNLLYPGEAALFKDRADSVANGLGEAFSMELRCRDGSGQGVWVSLHCSRFIDPGTELSGLIYQLHDITSRRQAEDRLHHVAFHDSLTDLANRNCFNERLSAAVERNRTDAEQAFAVMFMDLDRFKLVNDSLGHQAGNALLCEVARRLSTAVRPGDLVARLGGDEFAILLEQVDDPAVAMALARRLLQVLCAPMMINGTEVIPLASIGMTFSDLGYRTADEVLRDADLAMYDAKADGSRQVSLFNQSMHERVAQKLKLESELRHAIGEGQLTLVYQPLYQLQPHRVIGFEALARWTHPERGAISPDVFITLAEESGNIEALTAWVTDQACGQLAQWQRSHGGPDLLGVHVNISGRDLTSQALVPKVLSALQRHGLVAGQLTLEITETTLMGKLTSVLDNMHQLRRAGVRFSIDDFGTGYSSLAYLSTLPIDRLKIDRSFINGMSEKQHNVEIVRAVHTLGRSLGKTIVAEGIETTEQLTMLQEIGIDVGQGYLLSRPLRADQVSTLLAGQPAASRY